MLAGVLIAAKKLEKNIGEKILTYLQPFFAEMDFEFHSPYKKHIKGNFSIFQDIQNLKTPMDSSHQDD